MLNFDQLDTLIDPILDLYERYAQTVIQDIARRLADMNMTSAAAWQMQRLIESGRVYENALDEIAELTGKSESELRALFRKAGVKAIEFDDAVYVKAGLKPIPLNLSPATAQVLASGLQKTGGVMRNLTATTALAAQNAFVDAADLAYMQVSSGAFDYITAIRHAVKEVAANGLTVIGYSGGRKDQLDVAMRRTILTGVSQTAGNLQLARAREVGQDLVEISAHIGARNKGEGPMNHESWQGKIYSLSGTSTQYPNFVEVTGYGTIEGLYGINCRHSFYPFFPGISKPMYTQAELDDFANKTVVYNGKEMSVYEATQVQRGIERKIRHWKRQAGALKAGDLEHDFETAKVKQYQAEMRDFILQMNTQYEKDGIKWHRQYEREQVIIPEIKPDRDLQLAQQGKLFDLTSEEAETVFNKPIDYSTIYSNDQIKAQSISFDKRAKTHILNSHTGDVNWLRENQDLVLKAIKSPLFIEVKPNYKGREGFNIAHLVYTGIEELPFLNVIINFRKNKARVFNMFRAGKQYLTSPKNKDRFMKKE